jgi:hypothetical protein
MPISDKRAKKLAARAIFRRHWKIKSLNQGQPAARRKISKTGFNNKHQFLINKTIKLYIKIN